MVKLKIIKDKQPLEILNLWRKQIDKVKSKSNNIKKVINKIIKDLHLEPEHTLTHKSQKYVKLFSKYEKRSEDSQEKKLLSQLKIQWCKLTVDYCLQQYVEENSVKKCTQMLKNGADPNAIIQGTTLSVLHAAVRKGNTRLVKVLLENKANPNIEVWNGTPLHHLSPYHPTRTERMLNILIQAGADVNRKSRGTDYSPLHVACHNGCVRKAISLVRVGAAIRTEDKYGFLPEQYIASIENRRLFLRGSYWTIVRLLFIARNDPNSSLYQFPIEVIVVIGRCVCPELFNKLHNKELD